MIRPGYFWESQCFLPPSMWSTISFFFNIQYPKTTNWNHFIISDQNRLYIPVTKTSSPTYSKWPIIWMSIRFPVHSRLHLELSYIINWKNNQLIYRSKKYLTPSMPDVFKCYVWLNIVSFGLEPHFPVLT